MRLAGFVHRDISPGNCLIYKGQTKISDLEYARTYAAPGIGTAPLTVRFPVISSDILDSLSIRALLDLWQ